MGGLLVLTPVLPPLEEALLARCDEGWDATSQEMPALAAASPANPIITVRREMPVDLVAELADATIPVGPAVGLVGVTIPIGAADGLMGLAILVGSVEEIVGLAASIGIAREFAGVTTSVVLAEWLSSFVALGVVSGAA